MDRTIVEGVDILVAEDSPTQAEQVRHSLERNGFRVRTAANGAEALALVGERQPDIVISDIVMPEMDGYTFCRRLKDDDATRRIPVILLTSLCDPRDVIKGLECGADNFIIKPYDERYLLSRIQYMLANVHLQGIESAQLGVEVILAGEKYFIKSDRIQILNLLLSSYEAAIQRNNDLRRSQDELELANMRLQEVDRLKSLFIASMSHELRTPLNSIIGFTSILIKEWLGPLNEEQKENLLLVERSGKHLLALINDVIDVSKIEAGQLESARETFDLHGVISEAVQSLENEAREKGLKLTVHNLHRQMNTDRRRLLQCVLNLLSNAVKFTEQGEVAVAVSSSKSQVSGSGAVSGSKSQVSGSEPETSNLKPETDFIEISVSDTGVGIREEDKGRLFYPFIRLDSPLTKKVPGTGLGLFLSRKLAKDVLGGDLGFTSSYGGGSRFVLTVPATLADK